MTFGGENVSVTRTDRGTDIFRLTGFLRDDDLTSHDGNPGITTLQIVRTYREQNDSARAALPCVFDDPVRATITARHRKVAAFPAVRSSSWNSTSASPCYLIALVRVSTPADTLPLICASFSDHSPSRGKLCSRAVLALMQV
jgi:hypothetical protein